MYVCIERHTYNCVSGGCGAWAVQIPHRFRKWVFERSASCWPREEKCCVRFAVRRRHRWKWKSLYMPLLLQPRENLFEASLANLAGTGPICLRGVLAELSELETARSGQPMRTGTLMDAVPIVFLGENADVGEGILYTPKHPDNRI